MVTIFGRTFQIFINFILLCLLIWIMLFHYGDIYAPPLLVMLARGKKYSLAAWCYCEWSEKKKEDKAEHKNSVNDEKSKESELVVVEDYFQIEIVDGETVFVCNICNEGLDNEQEITKHIKDNHESLMNNDSYTDTELYEGFDEEGHRII